MLATAPWSRPASATRASSRARSSATRPPRHRCRRANAPRTRAGAALGRLRRSPSPRRRPATEKPFSRAAVKCTQQARQRIVHAAAVAHAEARAQGGQRASALARARPRPEARPREASTEPGAREETAAREEAAAREPRPGAARTATATARPTASTASPAISCYNTAPWDPQPQERRPRLGRLDDRQAHRQAQGEERHADGRRAAARTSRSSPSRSPARSAPSRSGAATATARASSSARTGRSRRSRSP